MAHNAEHGGKEIQATSKTAKLMGLFTAAMLAVSPGCSYFNDNANSRHVHVDANNDGYCDEDGQSMNQSNSNTGSGYYHGYAGGGYFGGWSRNKTSSGTMSSGAKGGIGSHVSVSGGG